MDEGALRIAARRIGITAEDYRAHLEASEKWCTACKTWHARSAFPRDSSRTDGLHACCRESRHTPRKSAEERFKSKVQAGENDCLNWIGSKYPSGYGSFYFDGRIQPAHRVAWILDGRGDPGDLYVLHHCDNRSCVNPSHLFLGTHQDNMADMDAKGRRVSTAGESNAKAKLTEADVAEIRRLKGTVSQRLLAQRFGVSKTAIRYIHQGRNWRQFPGDVR